MNYELKPLFGNVIDGVFYPRTTIPSGIMRIALTNKCNYRCSHCFREGELYKHDQTLDIDYLKKIIEFAQEKYGLHTIKFTGGEPLLYPDLEAILKFTRQRLLNSEFTTNGFFLEEKLGLLVDCHVEYITVTLNTVNPDTYARLHKAPPGALERVISGIIKAQNEGIKVRLNLVALDIEGQNIVDVMKFACDNKIVMRVCEPTYVNGADITRDKAHFREIYNYILSKKSSKVVSACESVEYIRLVNGQEITVMHNLCDNRLCDSCGRYLYIRLTSDGKLKPCLSRRDTEVALPSNLSFEEMDKCFNLAVNHMGRGISANTNGGLVV